MRRISILIAILSFTVSANAGMFITVDGAIDPIVVSIPYEGFISIGIANDVHANQGEGVYFLGMALGGPANWDIYEPIFPFPFGIEDIGWVDEPEIAADLGIKNPFIGVTVEDPEPVPLLENRIVDGISLHCEGVGDVTLKLYDVDLNVLDTQVIHQVPEPATIVLLGLGAMMLRRRK